MKRDTRAAPLRRSLNRVPTVLGAERTPMIVLLLLASVLILSGATLVSAALGLVLLAAGVRGLQAAARVHPQATRVYREYVKLRPYYAARRRFPTPMPHRRACARGARPPLASARGARARPLAEGSALPDGRALRPGGEPVR